MLCVSLLINNLLCGRSRSQSEAADDFKLRKYFSRVAEETEETSAVYFVALDCTRAFVKAPILRRFGLGHFGSEVEALVCEVRGDLGFFCSIRGEEEDASRR